MTAPFGVSSEWVTFQECFNDFFFIYLFIFFLLWSLLSFKDTVNVVVFSLERRRWFLDGSGFMEYFEDTWCGENKQRSYVFSYHWQFFFPLVEGGGKYCITYGSIQVFLSKQLLYICIKVLGSLQCPNYTSSLDVFSIHKHCIMWKQVNILINYPAVSGEFWVVKRNDISF